MIVSSIKTHKITQKDKDLFAILNRYLPTLQEKSVVAIASKIVAITQGRMVTIKKVSRVSQIPRVSRGESEEQKDALIRQEAQYYLPRDENPYKVSLTITNNTLVATAGIDESNGNGNYILWPKDVQKVANKVRQYLREIRGVREIGVIITDSKTTPLRWGVTGIALSYSGFVPLKDYVGTPDLFGRKFAYEKLNIADSLATSAALAMGEGAEQTPLAVITDVGNLEFVDRNPTDEELNALKISINEDLYAPFLKSVSWKRGKK